MKKFLPLLFLFCYVACFSQSVTINTTNYSVEQLINQILINSPCVSGTNVKYKTGSQYGSTNGIGYFENTNANFPFSNGVVLSTGDVTKIVSPNNTILIDGNAAWTGDTDLEANLLSQSGITMNSVNASYIEFDFKPKSPNFDFSFLFASEEYGTSQCNFSDAFAFLLKDVTAGGSNVNLAVIPNTTIPVSVETIRDNAYNTNCLSANPSYFGAFNGSGFGPAINFNGQTIPMIASATGLNTSHIYRIKLVIADGGNNTAYDSAIFIKANSLNIGQNVLGLDYTDANKSTICPGSILPILSAASLGTGTTFVWEKEGVAFSPAQTGAILNLNTITPLISSGNHTFSVTYKEPGCTEITDEITIKIYPTIGAIATVPNIYICDTGAAIYDFDLTKNTSIIVAGNNKSTNAVGVLDDLPAGTIISYHLTNADANAGTELIASPFTVLSSESGKKIYVRIQNPTTLCYEIRSFQLQIVPPPTIATIPDNITVCARNITDIPLKANFDLAPQKSSIFGLQNTTYNIISYHSSFAGANNNTNIINTGGSTILLSSSTTIWARLQNISNDNCFVVTSFQITVSPLPLVDILKDVFVCTSYTLPTLINVGAEYWTDKNGSGTQLFAGSSIDATSDIYVFNQSGICSNQDSFKVTVVDLDEITSRSFVYLTEYRLPGLPYGKYFTQSGGTTTPGNTVLAAGTIINTSGINTIYVRFEDNTVTPPCIKETSFVITIIPIALLPDYTNQFGCSSYTLPSDPNGGIYYSGPNKGLPIMEAGTVINLTKTIYVYKDFLTFSSEKTFTVYIGLSAINPPSDINSCSAYILPLLIVGDYRTNSGGDGSLVAAGTSIDATTTLWYYVNEESCITDLPFTVTINTVPLPIMIDTTPQCDVYYLPPVAHSGNYFTGPLGTGKMCPVGFPVTTTQTMYFYDKAVTQTCYLEEKFLITISPSPLIDARPVEVLKCGENYVLDDLINGEYYEFSGGPSPTNPILPPGYTISSSKTIYVYAPAVAPNTCISEYSILLLINQVVNIQNQYACNTYDLPVIIGPGDYYTDTNGPHGAGIKLSLPYAPITSTTKLYIYAEENNRIACFDEDDFTVTIYNSPVIPAIAPVIRCESYELPPFIAPITSYFTQSGGPGKTNIKKFPGDLITASRTIYAYAEEGILSTVICPDEKPIVITIMSKPNPVLDVTVICHDFETGIVTNSHSISGYNAPQYAFEWKTEDGTLLSTASDFSTSQIGKYTLTVTDLSIFGCTSDAVPFTVIESSPPASISLTTSGWFTDSQTITVNAIPSLGDGSNFLYSLDGSSPQTSNIFTNVSPGTHEISISDALGCGATIPVVIKLINAPKFFTPNGDGFNDTWNISGIPNGENLKLYIFDRYGKLLKELFPNDSGWDGTFKGYSLPADDYWFSISYTEDNVSKEYKSHFSLKR
ncbi:T9SS type B sorting domain-containing protein [Flavobacterium sp. ZB4P23]|uniref:T9SS type B sorting domain-containing protein n=1 Tax=unclassified Flavobacterium TaxID=196869 RepID=UPI000F816CA1|nr:MULTISPECIES: choice-of-anchor L domain-containing protein [unclassified Flavobacterium]RTY84628.1 T9SS type B sorting domain-containing protein [Flavobacterium sp. ZB4P23]RTY92000.1 T9SS type B sorting domain-containing protein [Flavobacterium sp. RSP46]